MKITELPVGSSMNVRSSRGLDYVDFETRIVKVLPEENAVLVDAITKNGKPLSFQSSNIVNVVSVVSKDEEKVYPYHNTEITYHKEKDENHEMKYYHRIETVEDVEPANRRKYYRVFLGLEGIMQGGEHRRTYEVTVRDVSVGGLAVMCPPEVDLSTGTRVRVTFLDNQLGKEFRLRCVVVRKTALSPTKVVYGCALPQISNAIGQYVAEKQRDERKLRSRHVI